MKSLIRKFLHNMGLEVYRYPEGCERLMPHLIQLLRRHRIDTVIDVGANAGQFASQMRGLDQSVRIHSVEPNPRVFRGLADLAARDPRWSVHECALGRAPGRLTLNVFASSDFSSCLPANEFGVHRFGASLQRQEQIEVALRTLDGLLDSLPDTDVGSRILLKLDTQGFDMEVLLGASATLERTCAIVTEASVRPIYEGAATLRDTLAFMDAKGFSLSGFFPVSRDDALDIIESDCVFVRTASLP